MASSSSSSPKKLRIFVVLGELSGDDLAADLYPHLVSRAESLGYELEVEGLAGHRLKNLGVNSLFPISDISVMGVSGVIRKLGIIWMRVHSVVRAISSRRPDLVLLIDSPEFTHAVARRVRRRCPDIPIIDYVCPSVWAWRSGRAAKMTKYVDHVLALLPFEPESMLRLGGPPTTFVGHPLADSVSVAPSPTKKPKNPKPLVVLLPGSRLSELTRLGDMFGDVLDRLSESHEFDSVLCAVPHLRERIESLVSGWKVKPRIVDSSENDAIFATADVALAASGTVSLQLALHRVPMVITYKLDFLGRIWVHSLFRGWSVALPNLIAGWPLVPEYLNHEARAERIARMLARLLDDSPERRAQLSGFDEITSNMRSEHLVSERAATAIFDHLKTRLPTS